MFDPQKPVYFLNPRFEASGGAVSEVRDPATLAPVGRFAETTAEDIGRVLGRVRTAQAGWAKLDAKSRATALHRLANAIEQADLRTCAELMTREPKPEIRT